MKEEKQKYNNSRVYFDPFTGSAYRDISFGSMNFRSLKSLSSSIAERCYQFDSMHEYYAYRIALLCLPAELQLLRQVNILVVPKSELGTAISYRADLLIACNWSLD